MTCRRCEIGGELISTRDCPDCGEREADVAAAYRAGRARERSEIVEWLTRHTVAYGEQPRLDHLVEAIERGDHTTTAGGEV